MKILLFLINLFLSFSYIFAHTYYLNVNLKDGTKVTYELNDINRIDFNGITSVEDAQKLVNIVKTFKLLQNYPNPFNPSTTIKYEIPKSGKVIVRIFDLNGRLIKTIVEKNQQSGGYSVVWNGITDTGVKVASGLYVYSVNFENSILSKKMILIK